MGTAYLVRAADCPAGRCNEGLAEQVATRLQRLDAQYSHYAAASEVTRFNEHSDDSWFTASHELVEIVELAADISRLTDGAFDITVGRAVNAWGFGPGDPELPPADTAIADAQLSSGYVRIESRMVPAGLRKRDPQIHIDLSAIAKGYAVDQVAYLLEYAGITNYVVDIGGELRAAGMRSDGQPWRVGIDTPKAGLTIDIVLTPGENAVATSGDYRNFYMLDGKRIGHTIDPDSAAPVEHALSSVTVIDPLAARADALATALMVMGPEEGRRFAEQMGVPALFLIRTAAGLDTRLTDSMQFYLRRP